MKKLILLVLLPVVNLCLAQKTLLVSPAFQPNTSYIITSISRDSSQINVTRSEEALSRIKASGKQLEEIS
jgi:hypothetical protein